MPVSIARRVLTPLLATRTGFRLGLAATILFLGSENLQTAVAQGDTRTISLHHVHTNEDLTITYKRNGRYDEAALKKINWILRDWRRNEEIAMDPQMLDIVWEVHRAVDAKQPIHIIGGYRAPATNAMLRRKSNGVAQHSQHMLGKAMDFFIPGAKLEDLRNIALRLQRGGIGYYPGSGSPFVHVDVGSVRHWPGISREEMVRIFPNGRTVHVPSDGKPLSGYALARADIERGGSQPSANSLNSARQSGVVTAQHEPAATVTNPLAKLFGLGKSEPAEEKALVAMAPAPKPKPAPVAKPQPPKPEVKMAAALPPKAPSFAANDVPWPDQPKALSALPDRALAYAPLPGPELNTRPASPPRNVESKAGAATQAGSLAVTAPAYIPRQTSIAVRQPDGKPVVLHTRRVQTGEAFDDPWLRAAIVAPSLTRHLTASQMGAQDYRGLAIFMHKPASLVTMSFGEDPNPGLMADRFSGQAVVFVATTTFRARTAQLQ